MTNLPPQLVIDASVGIKLFVMEEWSDKVHDLFGQLASVPPAKFYIPDLFYIECTNILLKYSRRFGRPIEDSKADVADLSRLTLNVVPTHSLMEAALMLADKYTITAYDACYLALADKLHISLLTADKELAQRTNSVWIGDFEIPTD